MIVKAVLMTTRFNSRFCSIWALAVVTLGICRPFIKAAYDIRKVGNVSLQHGGRIGRKAITAILEGFACRSTCRYRFYQSRALAASARLWRGGGEG